MLGIGPHFFTKTITCPENISTRLPADDDPGALTGTAELSG